MSALAVKPAFTATPCVARFGNGVFLFLSLDMPPS